jgi:Universal stress protein UspA and related nucleotide-binding proteins
MSLGFKKIGLAIAFSPTASALLAEAARMARLFQSELILIHVGDHHPSDEEKMQSLIRESKVNDLPHKVVWHKGKPAKEILKACQEHSVDLLVAGALKKENLVHYYIGTIARQIMRKAACSFLMITNPKINAEPFQNIVVNAEDSPFVEDAIAIGCQLGMKDHAHWVHIVRELKLLGLTLSANEQCTEEEYMLSRNNMMREEIQVVEKILERVPHDKLKINIKMISGKSGFELARFAERKHADLLVVGSPARRFSIFDRVFTHDLEYIFANMPCSLLVIHPRKNSA